MRILLKYIFWALAFLSLIIYYFLGTKLGHISIRYLVEDYASKKMNNKLEILSLDINNYPLIKAEIQINDTARLSLEGNSDSDNMNIAYHLRGESFHWNTRNLIYPINLQGTIHGKRSALLVQGEGEVFDGKTSYSFIRKSSNIENLKLNLEDISAKYLLEFVNYKLPLEGNVDAFFNFEYLSSFRKKGKAIITMKKASMPEVLKDVEFSLNGTIEYKDLLRNFFVDIDSESGKLNIANGHYNKSAKLLTAEYDLQINELADFESFLGHRYQGKLNTVGKLKYEAKNILLIGDSTSYGGLLEYRYKNKELELEFKHVSLKKLLHQLSFPALLEANVYGSASYDIKDKIVLINTALKEARFRRTKMTDTIYKVTGIDILKDVYNNSLFTAAYQNFVLTSFLQIDNGVNHLYLRDTRMNSKTNKITADFEVLIEEQEFVGEIYGTLKDPKVNLDISKLIKYQIKKKINNFFGRIKSLK